MSYDLQRAITRGDINAVRRCLDAGADIEETRVPFNGATPLMVAVSSGISRYPQFPGNANKGSNQMAELLLDRGANVNFTKRSGRTALSIACDHANINMVKFLLSYGVTIDWRSHNTVQSASYSRMAAIKALFDAAAPPEKRILAHRVLRIRLHVVGPRGDHKASGRHEIFRCKTQVSRAIMKRVVSFIGPADRW